MPFIYEINPEEVAQHLEDLEPETQRVIMTKGLVNILPTKIKDALLPIEMLQDSQISTQNQPQQLRYETEGSSTDTHSQENIQQINNIEPNQTSQNQQMQVRLKKQNKKLKEKQVKRNKSSGNLVELHKLRSIGQKLSFQQDQQEQIPQQQMKRSQSFIKQNQQNQPTEQVIEQIESVKKAKNISHQKQNKQFQIQQFQVQKIEIPKNEDIQQNQNQSQQQIMLYQDQSEILIRKNSADKSLGQQKIEQNKQNLSDNQIQLYKGGQQSAYNDSFQLVHSENDIKNIKYSKLKWDNLDLYFKKQQEKLKKSLLQQSQNQNFSKKMPSLKGPLKIVQSLIDYKNKRLNLIDNRKALKIFIFSSFMLALQYLLSRRTRRWISNTFILVLYAFSIILTSTSVGALYFNLKKKFQKNNAQKQLKQA